MSSQKIVCPCFITGLVIIAPMLILLLHSCEKIEPERVIKIKTNNISDIQYGSSVAEGIFIDLPDDGISEHGHCWSTSENPTITDPRTTLGSRKNKGTFQSQLNELSPGTNYYVRAYALQGDVETYGENKSFTTLTGNLASLNTYEASNIKMNSARCGGEITSENGYLVTARGICWNTTGSPSIDDNFEEIGSGLGSFDTELTGLIKRTTYYVKAYATNQLGTNYGNVIVFTTSDLPAVSTVEINDINPNSATCIGNVTDDGLTEVTRGFCWGISPEPTIDVAHSENGTGTGEFQETIMELPSATRLYIRAYATNINGTVYGDEIVIITPFTDPRNSITYKVVIIGDQFWMAENLNYGTYINSSESQAENSIVEKYCYNNNEANCEVYGGYYTWNEMMQYVTTESVQGVCPSGWHVPSDAEWKTMEMTLGMSQSEADDEGWRGTNEGGKLKLQGTDIWQSPNEGATNESGFSAMPGGYFDITTYQDFVGVITTATFWVSTEAPDAFTAYFRTLDYLSAQIYRSPGYQGNSTPVRCVKD